VTISTILAPIRGVRGVGAGRLRPTEKNWRAGGTEADMHDDEPICVTCGVQRHGGRRRSEDCPICADERQYVGWGGQRWTSLTELRDSRHNRVEAEGPGLFGIGTEPSFAIGQRALLVQTPAGNVLWDCISLVDDDTVAAVEALGGLRAIAISHPHFYASMAAWSEAFGGVPIYLHEADAAWVEGTPPAPVELWSGDTRRLGDGLTLVRCGIHFDGGAVLHWADGESGRGALMSGDIFQVVMDRRWVSFMWSYPNLIPERPETIERALTLVEPLSFERIYGAFWGRFVAADGAAALRRSAERYWRQVGYA
jgi:glyoxylase-like metal-dependent hydrolase (beta-lactamase superfamily II)